MNISRRNTEDTLIDEHVYDNLDPERELKVTFNPPLYMQRRLWILNTMRAESVTQVLDVGCGEGQLLSVLCQPAPWLRPPPLAVLPPSLIDSSNEGPTATQTAEEVTYLYPTILHGLDISAEDLAFAISDTAPVATEEAPYNAIFRHRYTSHSIRWEDLQVKIWKGGLQSINEEFIDIECIVSTEVIEHLPPDVFPAFAPVLLGVYHPRFFLITTPSYDFNARFVSPTAPKSARQGYLDPTGRTDRIFRHDDHKFEWTVDEFEKWCKVTADDWGYEVNTSAIGRALEKDPWERDEGLGGASQVAVFRRSEQRMSNLEREKKGREVVDKLGFTDDRHELLASYQHAAHPSSMKPKPLEEIGNAVKAKMEQFKVTFIRLEEIWFEHDIATMCGGWIELLPKAVEESEDLNLNRGNGIRKGRSAWTIELSGAPPTPTVLWPTEDGLSEAMTPPDNWMPEEDTSAENSDWGEVKGDDYDAEEEDGDEKMGEIESYATWGFKPSLSPVHWASDGEEGWGGKAGWLEDMDAPGVHGKEPEESSATESWKGDWSGNVS